MTKYILIYIHLSDGFFSGKVMPGTMFEVDRFDSIEAASKDAKKRGFNNKNSLILQYYDITD